MSEVYEFEDEVGSMPPLVFSDYSNKVYGKHLNSYGEEGARKTRSAAQKVLSDSLAQEKDPSKNNNVLLVGKVQSGKTSNLEALVGLALDNGFNLIVMYGGYDNTLLKQTVRRFRKTMDSPKDTDEEDDLWDPSTPNIFTTDSKDELCINNLTADTIRSFLDEGIPVFIITIKDARRIRGVNEKLNDLKDYPIQSLVIDDEGDQASLNNVKDKESDASATYAAICTMKEVLGDPLYFSVTATPQANIFLNSLSVLRPNSVHLLHPARGYCGADFFHREDHGIIYTVPDEMDIARDDNRSPESLQFAVRHFIMASAILKSRQKNRKRMHTHMVIHAFREVDTHSLIYLWVASYIDSIRDAIEDSLMEESDDAHTLFSDVYNKCFAYDARQNVPFDNNLLQLMSGVLDDTGIALHNGQDRGTRETIKFKSHQIYIGAQLLERGITFDRLLTTYFTRWPKSDGNMDTNLQRARWFGYRSEHSDLIKLFTTETIADEFTFLAEMEDDLWRQFSEVEAGELPIDEIVILAEDSKQKPTRRSVADYFSIYTREWLKQRYRTSNKKEIEHNNKCVRDFLSRLTFVDKSYARDDDKPNCQEALCPGYQVAGLMHSLEGIYVDGTFSQIEVEKVLKSTPLVAVLLMTPEGHVRHRSFYSADKKNVIKALHQGRTDDGVKYLGDKLVISDAAQASIQIFNICPEVDGVALESETQYMFALYRENELKKGYVGA
ncbi:Z1 domain-containing protein [Adlercreutzia muris]|uniref:Z1 domain-containing protein n=1 Tax=Adlercreutzia muris TaxID=1796610 RepID=UPI003512F172